MACLESYLKAEQGQYIPQRINTGAVLNVCSLALSKIWYTLLDLLEKLLHEGPYAKKPYPSSYMMGWLLGPCLVALLTWAVGRART